MQVQAKYSHLNGYEYLRYRHSCLWNEVVDVIASVDAEACRTKVSKEKTMKDRLLYSPSDMNARFKTEFEIRGW